MEDSGKVQEEQLKFFRLGTMTFKNKERFSKRTGRTVNIFPVEGAAIEVQGNMEDSGTYKKNCEFFYH